MGRPLSELARVVDGIIDGDATINIVGVNVLREAEPGQLSFFASARYRGQLQQTRASAVLVPKGTARATGATFVQVDNPHLAFAAILREFYPQPERVPGISPQAFVDASARVDSSATVMPFASVGPRAVVGPRCVLFPGAFVGEGARLGADCVLRANAVVEHGCVLGDRVTLHASAVIGADGFGYAQDSKTQTHVKIPQVGTVVIEDDVEIGAGSCVDRATVGQTLVGRGTKIDNLVQVGHNVRIGRASILCGQSGVSGSSELGEGVVLAGQAGVAGHIKVGDRATVGAQAGVMSDVEPGTMVTGAPAFLHQDFLKSAAGFARLPEYRRQLRELLERVEALERGTKP